MDAPSLITVQPVLSHAQQLCQEYSKQLLAADPTYNIFTVLRIQEQETKHTLLLADLLDPEGHHGAGATFLVLFLLKVGISDPAATTWRVKAEESHSYGRWDIAIHGIVHGTPTLILLENKINAAEGEQQLARYLQAAKEHEADYQPADTWLVYLTPTGRFSQSCHQTGGATLLRWAYHQEIRAWLNECLSYEHIAVPLRSVLSQYLNLLIDNFNQHVQHTLSDKLAEHLIQHNLLAEADAVQQALFQAGIKLQLHFWEELEQELKDSKLPLFEDLVHKFSPDSITDFYTRPRSRNDYGIGIELLREPQSDRCLLLWLGLYDRELYLGVFLFQQGKYKDSSTLRSGTPLKTQLQQFASNLDLELQRGQQLLSIPLKCPLPPLSNQLTDLQLLARADERQQLVKGMVSEIKQVYKQFPRN